MTHRARRTFENGLAALRERIRWRRRSIPLLREPRIEILLRLRDHHGGTTAGRRRLRAGIIAAERRMLVRLRNERRISAEVMRRIERELDLEESRLEF